MKKWIFPVLLGVVAILYFVSKYNKIVAKEGTTKGQWANVESAYQRRADLIPNLVETVKGYAAHEKETLEAVIQARAEATKTTIDPTNLTPENMAQFQKSQEGLTGALSKLMLVVERYPDLKANQNFLELQSQLESTENRINVERVRYNEMAAEYNIFISQIPTNIVASIAGKKEMSLFQSAEGSDVAPKVEF